MPRASEPDHAARCCANSAARVAYAGERIELASGRAPRDANSAIGVAGGSVTASVCDAEVAVSPVVMSLAVTVSVAAGWPGPLVCDVSDSPVIAVPALDVLSVMVQV